MAMPLPVETEPPLSLTALAWESLTALLSGAPFLTAPCYGSPSLSFSHGSPPPPGCKAPPLLNGCSRQEIPCPRDLFACIQLRHACRLGDTSFHGTAHLSWEPARVLLRLIRTIQPTTNTEKKPAGDLLKLTRTL
eukprot:1031950-Pelagomonas_calceolata.AAC.3